MLKKLNRYLTVAIQGVKPSPINSWSPHEATRRLERVATQDLTDFPAFKIDLNLL